MTSQAVFQLASWKNNNPPSYGECFGWISSTQVEHFFTPLALTEARGGDQSLKPEL